MNQIDNTNVQASDSPVYPETMERGGVPLSGLIFTALQKRQLDATSEISKDTIRVDHPNPHIKDAMQRLLESVETDILPGIRQKEDLEESMYQLNCIFAKGRKLLRVSREGGSSSNHNHLVWTYETLKGRLFSAAAEFMIIPVRCGKGHASCPYFIVPDVSVFSRVFPKGVVKQICLGDILTNNAFLSPGETTCTIPAEYDFPDIISEASEIKDALWPNILARAWSLRRRYTYPGLPFAGYDTTMFLPGLPAAGGATALFLLLKESAPLKSILAAAAILKSASAKPAAKKRRLV